MSGKPSSEETVAPTAPASETRRRVFSPAEPEAAAPAAPPAPKADEPVEDFGALLAEENAVARQRFEKGESVSGKIVLIGAEYAFVDLGGKGEATIAVVELKDEHGELTAKVGDPITARVIGFDGGSYRLGRGAAGGVGSEAIQEAFDAGLTVQGTVVAVNKGGLEVQVMGQRAFCPVSQIDVGFVANPADFVGTTHTFRITEYAKGGKKFVVSRAALLREERATRAAELRAKLQVGAVLEGEVRSLQDYGVFVDLGGLDGLVHISEIAHARVQHPSEVLKAGQKVRVEVLEIQPGAKGERISLSIKRTQADPWTDVEQTLSVGSKQRGRVVRLAPFGAFVELRPGLEGLIHVSEMSWEKKINHPQDVLKENDQVEVSVLSIDTDTKRIALSLKSLSDDPWLTVGDRFKVGDELEGSVERVADFGVFVKLAPGIVGLLPASESATKPGSVLGREFAVGSTIACRILALDEDRRRLTLTRRSAEETAASAGEGEGPRQPQRRRGPRRDEPSRDESGGAREHREAGGNFATLGDLLTKQLKDKKPR